MTTTSIVDHPAADPVLIESGRGRNAQTPRPPSLAEFPPAPGGNGDSHARRNAGARNSYQCPARVDPHSLVEEAKGKIFCLIDARDAETAATVQSGGARSRRGRDLSGGGRRVIALHRVRRGREG